MTKQSTQTGVPVVFLAKLAAPLSILPDNLFPSGREHLGSRGPRCCFVRTFFRRRGVLRKALWSLLWASGWTMMEDEQFEAACPRTLGRADMLKLRPYNVWKHRSGCLRALRLCSSSLTEFNARVPCAGILRRVSTFWWSFSFSCFIVFPCQIIPEVYSDHCEYHVFLHRHHHQTILYIYNIYIYT